MKSDQIAQLFAAGQWDKIAAAIDTGEDNPETSRGLIVFNPSDKAISGIALFHVDMPWRIGKELPSIRVVHLLTGNICASSITTPMILPAALGQIHGRIVFDLRFAVIDVPAHGWDTYIAEYVETLVEMPLLDEAVAAPELVVVETMRHSGNLSPRWGMPGR